MRRRLANLTNARRCIGRGFTLIEVAVTTVIIGLGMSALVSMMASSGSAHHGATELTTAMNLANNIHELAERLAYSDGAMGMESGETIANCNSCDDLKGLRLGSGGTSVVDAIGLTMPTAPGMNWIGWQQHVDVNLVDPNNVRQTLSSTDTSTNNIMRITCSILHNGAAVYQQAWNVVQTK